MTGVRSELIGLPMGRWIVSFNAVDAATNGVRQVGVTHKDFRRLADNGDVVSIARLKLAQDVVSDPGYIVNGWGRDGTQECQVFVGRPPRDFSAPGIDVPAKPGMFFLVFVMPNGDLDYWNWRPQDPDNPDVPKGVKGDVIWPQPIPT